MFTEQARLHQSRRGQPPISAESKKGQWPNSSSVEDGAAEVLNEPKLGVILGDTLELAETVGLSSSGLDSTTGSLEADGEVHAENTCGGVVLNSEIDMFVDTKSEVT